jgi:hypothetical protein
MAAVALWCKAHNFMPDGNISSSAQVNTGTGGNTYFHNNHATGIWGLCGNIWEWCGGTRLQDGYIEVIANNDAAVTGADQTASSSLWKRIRNDGVLVDKSTTTNCVKYGTAWSNTAFSSVSVTPATTSAGAELLECLGLIPHAGSSAADYGSDAVWATISGERLPHRGGFWYLGASSGVFALSLDITRSSYNTPFGFRAAFCDL